MNNQTTDGSKLSNEQKQKMKKYAVFALMGIICAGCMWFIFAPSADEKANREAQSGFNSDIPMPKDETIIGDKRDAYEQEQVRQRQAERMRSLNDFSSLLGETGKTQSDELVLLTDEPSDPTTVRDSYSGRPSSVQSSMTAYHDINRTLGNFYETPRDDHEKERLQAEMEELRLRLDEQESRKNAADEQMALMEKSFEMAAKYIPMNATTGTGATVEQPPTNPPTNTSGKTQVVPVSGWIEQTVTALPQEMSAMDVMLALSQPRNLGFFTATGETSKERKNTISACIHSDQTVMDGESVRLRLTEPMQAGRMLIHENAILSGFARIQGERLQINIQSLEYGGNIIPVEISVYDTDGQRGIFIPHTQELNAAKEIVAGMGTNVGTSISLSDDAGKQLAADMGRSVIQGTSQFLSKKLREVKVHLKAGYKVLLLPNDR